MRTRPYMKEYTSVEELIGNMEKLISVLQSAPVNNEQIILLEYIGSRSTVKAAKFMRESGVKSPAGKSFQPSDVSAFIKAGHESLDPLLLDFARSIFRANWKAVGG